jgi:hypothetical protein
MSTPPPRSVRIRPLGPATHNSSIVAAGPGYPSLPTVSFPASPPTSDPPPPPPSDPSKYPPTFLDDEMGKAIHHQN